MRDLINQFGGKDNLLVIVLLFGLFFFLNSLFGKRKLRLVFGILFSIFILLQITSLYFTQTFIGYQFYIHANLRGITGLYSLFSVQIFSSIILFIFLIISLFFSSNVLSILNTRILRFTRIVGVLGIFIALTQQTKLLEDSSSLVTLFKSGDNSDFKEVLRKYNMQDYITNSSIESSSNKDQNIIIISMESLERGYLSTKYEHLTPNLKKLQQNWTFLPLKPNMGSEWTSGSMYTCLTGFPALFGADWNDIFYTNYATEVSGISHVFNQQNYNTTYINGNTEHSGVNAMLNVFEFDQIVDFRSVPSNGYESKYGLRDLDLFNIAKAQVIKNAKTKKKSALFISTTDSHFPNGIYDERMEKFVTKKSNDLEFTVACLDYLIGDFIQCLDSIGELKNSKIFLFPDHLKMGNPNMFKETGNRGLYCVSNADITQFQGKDLYQIDLPKIILSGSEITHNLKFLTDYIQGNKNEYIISHQAELTEINTSGNQNSSIERFSISPKSLKYDEYKKDPSRFIAHAGGEIKGMKYTNCKEALNESYAKGFKLFELDLITTSDGCIVAAHDWVHWANHSGYKGKLPVSKEEFLKYKISRQFTPLDMDSINLWFANHPDAILVTDKINEPKKVASEFVDRNRLMMELFTAEAIEEGIQENILSPMPSHDLFAQYTMDEIKDLHERGINTISISRRYINKNKDRLKLLRELGIKTYVFHLNMDMNIDEDFVVKHEMDFIHGIYADDWDFGN